MSDLYFCNYCNTIYARSEVHKSDYKCPECDKELIGNDTPQYKEIAKEYYKNNFGG